MLYFVVGTIMHGYNTVEYIVLQALIIVLVLTIVRR